MDYTITPQYHEKKDCYIYVVRLTDRVGKDDFTSLSELAKSHKGYYSSFRGVNGFVFKTEEHAKQFCEDMMAILDTLQDYSTSPSSNTPTAVEPSTLTKLPQSGMELHKALRAVIQTEGETIITEVRLVNILDDFKAYSEMPTAKYILRAIISDGFAHKLLLVGKWNNDAINLATRFAATTGFMPDAVEILFKSIAFGLGWIKKCETSTPHSLPTPVPQPLPNPIPTSPRSNGWTKKMDEDKTDAFFKSITEYDHTNELKYNVNSSNPGFFIDIFDQLNLSCEIIKTKRVKDHCPSLHLIAYDLKGRIRQDCQVGYFKDDEVGSKEVISTLYGIKPHKIGKLKLKWL
ncbi:MAG: hypothetical protein HDR94_04940 [Bacteroides sp.]|nr:hypothetical protein [Bacteroides sp.]